MEIRLIKELVKGKEWYISYLTLAPCKCRHELKKIIIKQKNKPTTKQIENAINNKG